MSTTPERKAYASDLTDEPWQIIEPLLPEQKEGGRERQVDLREIMNAINYRTRTGCAWEMLPHDLPAKSTVYEYYRAWQRDGTWQTVHDVLRGRVRQQAGRDADASAGMLDSQSVKTTEARGERGYDAGKKVKGRKRHLLVDTLGLIMAVVVTMASVQDRGDGGKLAFAGAQEQPRLEKVWADGDYRGEFVDGTQANCAWELEIVSRPPDQKGFAVLPRRSRGRTHLGMAQSLPPVKQRVRSHGRKQHGRHAHCHDPPHAPQADKKPKPRHQNENLLAHVT